MNLLSASQIKEIKDATAELRRVSREHSDVCTRLLTPGVVLCWRSRGYLQTGTVIRVLFGDDVQIQNHKTLKTIRLDLYWVDWDATAKMSND